MCIFAELRKPAKDGTIKPKIIDRSGWRSCWNMWRDENESFSESFTMIFPKTFAEKNILCYNRKMTVSMSVLVRYDRWWRLIYFNIEHRQLRRKTVICIKEEM